MKHILKNPAVNAAGLSIFTAFYAIVFIIISRQAKFKEQLFYTQSAGGHPFWDSWSTFLASGRQAYIAYALILLTILIVLMLLFRQRPYDEYHTANLIHCLAVATILTLAAIAGFYLMILSDANGIVEKFTLFIVIHWTTVVLADLVYVFISRWR